MGHRPNKAPEKCNVTEAQDKAFKIASVNKFKDLKEDGRTQTVEWNEEKCSNHESRNRVTKLSKPGKEKFRKFNQILSCKTHQQSTNNRRESWALKTNWTSGYPRQRKCEI